MSQNVCLGLDISTSCVGIAIMAPEVMHGSRLLSMRYIPLAKVNGIWSKAESVEDVIADIADNYDVEHVFVEENLQMFRPGLSSAATLSLLSKFNGIVSYITKKHTDVEPVFLNVNAARKSVGLKVDRKSKLSTKEQVLNWTVQEEPAWSPPTRALKSGPNKGDIRLLNEAYDMADAYVIARAGIVNI